MNKITVNGTTYSVRGKNVSIVNGKVIVDDETIATGLSGLVKVTFDGDLASLACDDATINGNIKGDVACDNLKCGDIGGDVSADNVICKNVSGSITADTVKHG